MDLSKLLSWIPGWLGFLLLILTGVLLLVLGMLPQGTTFLGTHPADHRASFIITAVFAIAIGVFSWIVGGVSRVKGRTGDIGVLVEVRDLPWWGWVVDAGLVVVAFVALMIVKAVS
jgi:hypothetical protein